MRASCMPARTLLLGLTTSAMFSAAAADLPASYRYYCPRSNSTYVWSDNSVDIVSGPSLPFRRTREELHEEPARRSAHTTDCSDATFLCLRVGPAPGQPTMYVFMPRELEPGRVYRFNGMDAVAYYSTEIGPPAKDAQVVLWQRLNGRETPATLTISPGRGVIYVDALDLWTPPSLWPPRAEVCVLSSKYGLFKDVRIHPPSQGMFPEGY
jgi:hypothetical protein